MDQALRGSLAVALAAATWGTWKLWLPPGGVLDPAAQGGIILTVSSAGAALAHALPPPAARTSPRPAPTTQDHAWLALFGLSEAANYLLYFKALSLGDSAAACVSHYLAPVLVALASPLLGEPMGRRVPAATALAFAGTVAIVGVGGTGPGTRAAALLGAASAVFYAGNIIVSKRLSRCYGPWQLVGLHNAIAAPFVWAMSATPPWSASWRELGLAAAGALVGGTLAAGLYLHGLARVSAAKAAVLSYLEPVGAATVGALVLGEPASAVRVAAIALVLATGVAVALERPSARPVVGPARED